jgi:hypothetical protein
MNVRCNSEKSDFENKILYWDTEFMPITKNEEKKISDELKAVLKDEKSIEKH